MMLSPSSTRRRAASVAALAATLSLLGACVDSSTDPTESTSVAYLQIPVDASVNTTTTIPTVSVFKISGISFTLSGATSDQCRVTPFGSDSQEQLTPVNAGNALQLQIGSASTQLVPSDAASGRLYSPPSNTPLMIVNGDEATLTIPGDPAGFPASTMSLKTAEAVNFSPISVGSSTSDLTLAWNGAGGGSTMLVSLRYRQAGQSVTQQVLCFLVDDGSAIVLADILGPWRSSGTTDRRAVATRFRTTFRQSGQNVTYGIASYTVEVPVTAP